MLKDRGYEVDEKEMKMTKQEFIDKFGMSPKREELIISTQIGDESDDPSDRVRQRTQTHICRYIFVCFSVLLYCAIVVLAPFQIVS